MKMLDRLKVLVNTDSPVGRTSQANQRYSYKAELRDCAALLFMPDFLLLNLGSFFIVYLFFFLSHRVLKFMVMFLSKIKDKKI